MSLASSGSMRTPLVLAHASAERDQGVDQAEVVECLGSQPARDAAHVVDALPGRLCDLLERRLAVRGRGVGCALGLHCHRGQLLPELVVQLARDARTLLFLGGQCPADATAPLLLEAIEHAVERLGEGRHLRV